MTVSAASWLDELPALGELPPAEAAARLREVGEDEFAAAIEAAGAAAPVGVGLLGGRGVLPVLERALGDLDRDPRGWWLTLPAQQRVERFGVGPRQRSDRG